MRNYCTFFDHRYADKGVVLFLSLIKHCSPCRLYVLCLDNLTETLLKSLNSEEIVSVSIEELLSFDKDLAKVRDNRSLIEFYFTCKPSLCLYVFDNYCDVDTLTYLDSDMFYCNDPAPIDEEMEGYSVGLTPHRFPEKLRVIKKVESSGRFNAGWIMFRNDANGRTCLQWWRERCLEWCYDRVDGGRYADQGYLGQMSDLFAGVKTIENEGVNAGPWNIYAYRVRKENDVIYLGDRKLVCYHYHGMKEIGFGLWETGIAAFRHRLNAVSKQVIYKKYLKELLSQQNYCNTIIGKSRRHHIRIYKSKADTLIKRAPFLFKFIKIIVTLSGGVVFNSLLLSQRQNVSQ